jgi:hypothetical protein
MLADDAVHHTVHPRSSERNELDAREMPQGCSCRLFVQCDSRVTIRNTLKRSECCFDTVRIVGSASPIGRQLGRNTMASSASTVQPEVASACVPALRDTRLNAGGAPLHAWTASFSSTRAALSRAGAGTVMGPSGRLREACAGGAPVLRGERKVPVAGPAMQVAVDLGEVELGVESVELAARPRC